MRHRLSLDGTWQFAPDPDRTLDPAGLARTELRAIQVPGPWQAQCPDLRDYTGLAWYRRTFRWDEPAETLLALAEPRQARVLTPVLGRPFEPAQIEAPTPWWRSVDSG